MDPDNDHTEVILRPTARAVARAEALRQNMPEKAPGLMISVLSSKGGCGATLIASNLAASIAKRGGKVCLVDLDMSKGDLAGFLDLTSGRTINPLLRQLRRLDEQLIEGTVDKHPSGLHILSQPFDIADIHQLDTNEVKQLLEGLRLWYDTIVIDVGSGIDIAALGAATMSDHVMLVTTPQVSSVRCARRTLRLLEQVEVPKRVVRLVVNKRHWLGGGLSDEDIVQQVEFPIVATVHRDDRVCSEADALGRLLSEVSPRARITTDVADLWSHIHGQVVHRSGFFSSLIQAFASRLEQAEVGAR